MAIYIYIYLSLCLVLFCCSLSLSLELCNVLKVGRVQNFALKKNDVLLMFWCLYPLPSKTHVWIHQSWFAIFIAWFARNGHLKVHARQLQTKQPEGLQKVRWLTQCNCHALSTEAPETDRALAPTPAPVNSTASLASGPPPSLWSWWWDSLDSLPQTSHDVGYDRPDVFAQSRCQICSGGSMANFVVGEICAKQARTFRPPRKQFAANFAAAQLTSSTPSAWLKIKILPLLSKLRRVQVGRFRHPATLLQPLSQTH